MRGDREKGGASVGPGSRASTEPQSVSAASGFDPSRGLIEQMARGIYEAEDPLSGDSISTVIHLSDHLFWDDRLPGKTDLERQIEAVRVVCRAAARAALASMLDPPFELIEAAANEDMKVARKDTFIGPTAAIIAWRAIIKTALLSDSDGHRMAETEGLGAEPDQRGPTGIAK